RKGVVGASARPVRCRNSSRSARAVKKMGGGFCVDPRARPLLAPTCRGIGDANAMRMRSCSPFRYHTVTLGGSPSSVLETDSVRAKSFINSFSPPSVGGVAPPLSTYPLYLPCLGRHNGRKSGRLFQADPRGDSA